EVSGYVIEGHVPAAALRRFLAEKPNAETQITALPKRPFQRTAYMPRSGSYRTIHCCVGVLSHSAVATENRSTKCSACRLRMSAAGPSFSAAKYRVDSNKR